MPETKVGCKSCSEANHEKLQVLHVCLHSTFIYNRMRDNWVLFHVYHQSNV